ncbi:MAG: hypothetical protein PQJ58_01080 [Spirochaetales bacterium]|nr:hypothetical protein [Spirochaetales bacterium]
MAKQLKAPKEKKSSFSKSFKRFRNGLSFLIVLTAAGFAFYTGWIQIRIPEGSYALVYTKTGGYDDSLIAAGEFVWRWENLFPTNMTIHFIELDEQKQDFTLSVYLPSGKLYGEYINYPDAFMYSAHIVYRFRLKETAFNALVQSGNYHSTMLEDLYGEYKSLTDSLITEYLKNNASRGSEDLPEMEKELKAALEDRDKRFAVDQVKFISSSYPDTALYEKSRDLFLAELDSLKTLEFEAEQVAAQIENSTMRKMDLLREYGAVFTEYPVLLEYFGLDRDKLDPSLLKGAEGDSSAPGSE